MNKNIKENNRRGFLSKMLVAGVSGVTLLSSSVYAKSSRSVSNTTSKLTGKQKDRLYFIYQEEKVARDVYIYANEKWPDEGTFASIKNSEQRHIDSAEQLCINYGIDLSAIDESPSGYGEFENDYLQELYNDQIDLIRDGDLLEAVTVGLAVENIDIGTLTDTINGEVGDMPADVIQTYMILREGSYNHRESFEAAIEREESKL